jgi:hypothetical protein
LRRSDVLGCRFELADSVLDAVARDPSQPMSRRIHAVYSLCQCDDDVCREYRDNMLSDAALKDVAMEMFGSDQTAGA